ncbi:Rpn family recombination-promoting nuclease/putative transposase [Skermanella mucosa]|uniref:Rpn family recombination-promoting nuclease/putative transposase n=1 Tax=Skermanella mucosa TaxID=1789672 RepID=UPI00192C59C4|nr:Rpn family recombination-promoting nuclease/putative transposase [Skermanella mucosa]UEM20587.1 Rpn family recombination-promoting nuclease/putative transposase [Skermanella mucosa]
MNDENDDESGDESDDGKDGHHKDGHQKGSQRLIRRHDQFAKQLLDQPGIADAFLRERLPAAVAACLSDAPAVDRSESFVDAALRERRGDRLYALSTWNGDPLQVMVLCEHKSNPDQGTFPQVLGYLGGTAVRGAVRRVLADGTVLMVPVPVYAVVLYHGTRTWSLPTRLRDAYGMPAGLVEAGLLDFGYVLVDLAAIADEDLSRHPDLQAGLLVLKYAGRDADPQETLERLLSAAAGAGLTVIVSVVRYLFGAAEALDRKRLKAMLGRIVPREGEKVVSIALREYLDEARAEALVQGRAEARADMLLRQLGRRFGPLPEAAVRRVREASPEDLDRWVDDIFDAPSLEAMLGDLN